MAELQEKQYELGGVVFGLFAPVAVEASGWTPGSPDVRTSDIAQPSGDGIRMGQDFKGATTWSFSMFTDRESEDAAWAALAPLAGVWDSEQVRTESGEVMPLRYRLGGQTRRVYGRPRRWTISPNNASMSGRIDVEADFTTVDHLFYDDTMQSKSIYLVPPLAGDLDAGIPVPFIPPFTSSVTTSSRDSTITIGGEVPTPIILEFHDVEEPLVRIGDWAAGLVDPVLPGNPVTIDARPWVRAATQANGGGVRVSPRVTRISKMWLPPGTHEVSFTGTTRSGAARVLVSWANAYRTPR